MTNSGSKKSHLERSKTSLRRRKKSERIGSDATEQRKPDDPDSKQEERYKTLVENIPCAVYSAFPGETGPTTFMSKNLKDWTGCSAEEFYQDPEAWPKCIYPDDREKAVNAYIEACKNEAPYNLEYRIVHRDTGQVRYVRDQGLLSKDTKGTLIRVDGIIMDITELKTSENELVKYRDHLEELVKERTAELAKANEVLKLHDKKRKKVMEALRESEEKYRRFYEDAPLGYQSLDASGNFLDVNKEWLNILGYSKEEVIGRFFAVFVAPESLETFVVNFPRFKEGGKTRGTEFEMIRKDGSRITVSFDGNIEYDEEGHFRRTHCIMHDITERKKAEEKLHQYDHIVSSSTDMLALLDKRFVYMAANSSYLKAFGKTPDKVIGHTVSEVFGKEFFETVIKPNAERCLAGEEVNYQAWFDFPAYEPRYMDINYYPYIDSNDEVSGFVVNGRDITEHKKAEEAVLEERDRAQKYLDVAAVMFVALDGQGNVTLVNKKGCELLGWDEPEIVGKNWFETFLPKHRREDKRRIFRMLMAGEIESSEYVEGVVLVKSGDKKIIAWHNTVLRNEMGNITGTLSSGEDITERKRAEERAWENEFRFRELFNNMGSGVAIYEVVGNGENFVFKDLNLAGEKLSQVKRDDVIGKSVTEAFPGVKEFGLFAVFQEVWKTGKGQYHPVSLYKDDRVSSWFENYVYKLPSGEIVAIYDNVTERKRAEEALRNEKEFTETALNAQQDTFFLFEPATGKAIRWNRSFNDITGYADEEISAMPAPGSYYSPEDLKRTSEFIEEVLETGIGAIELELICKDGRKVPTEYNVAVIRDEDGNPKYIISIGRDITERKRAEEALKESEERFRSLSNTAFDGIGITEQGRIVDANATFTDLFGYHFDEIIGKEVQVLVVPEDRKLVAERIRSGYEKPYEHKALRKDGSVLDIEVCGRSVLYKGRECRITAIRDITERKKAEEKLLDYQAKLKSLASQLSLIEERERRRIATELHDQIGQSLVFSKLKFDELQQSATSSELTKALNEICNNIGQVIQDTRTLTFDLSSPILNELGFEAAVTDWLDVQIREKHGIKTEFEDDGQPKPLDDDIQALLFRNVRELLFNVVKHANAQNVKVSVHKVDDLINISVEDNGEGFDPAEVASKATFGLFSIRERLEHLGGSFEIKSEPGSGSKITMTAPLK